ncbi:ABC-type branched-subunit amino acid transport system ATPase component [Bradyrhizobium sp. LB7.1]
MSALLSVTDAHVSYGKVEAVRSVSLEVGQNQIVTIVGANGAGKTTLLSAIMGVFPLKGRVAFAGQDLSRLDIEDRVAMGLGLVPEHRELFVTMNVEDNLELGAFRIERSKAKASMERVYTLFPRLKERRKQFAGTLSGGEQQMLAMGRALMGEPKLLMLDEPSLGLAPIIVADIFRIVTELRAAGVSVLLVEQNAQAALKIADQAYVMELGEFVLSGKASDIAANERVAASYLGFQHEGRERDLISRPYFPSPLVVEGGAKRRMWDSLRELQRGTVACGERPLTRLAALRRATLSHKAHKGEDKKHHFSAHLLPLQGCQLRLQLRDPCIPCRQRSRNIAGVELLRDVLRAVRVPRFDLEQDHLLRPRAIAFRHQGLRQRGVVLDHARLTPDLHPAAMGVVHHKDVGPWDFRTGFPA